MAQDTILINIMYTGDYTNKNIGHEIINLYKTDKGENYIYISPYGKLADDKYGGVSTVLLARPAEKGRLEIIAKYRCSNGDIFQHATFVIKKNSLVFCFHHQNY